MSRVLPTCYLNGAFLPLAEARISPLDRGFLFGDAVYEVIPIYGSRLFRLADHLERLERSLHSLEMPPVMPRTAWAEVGRELVRRNAAVEAYLYAQVSRGAEASRNHAWAAGTTPTVFAYLTALEAAPAGWLDAGVRAVTAVDTRWARRDIKSTALLANVLHKKRAVDAGAFETILLENGRLTEGASTSVHIVSDGAICAPPLGPQILNGTTRRLVEELAEREGLAVHRSAPISESELRAADEIWLSFATRGVLPVTRLDGAPVGAARPGPVFKRIHHAFLRYVEDAAGRPEL